MIGPLFVSRTIYGLGLSTPMSDIPVPSIPTADRIAEARRHIARARGALLTIWPNEGATHLYAAEAFEGLKRAEEVLT